MRFVSLRLGITMVYVLFIIHYLSNYSLFFPSKCNNDILILSVDSRGTYRRDFSDHRKLNVC